MSDLIERIRRRIQSKNYHPVCADCCSKHELMEIIDEESAKEEQEFCKWSKGLHSIETCWGDVSIKDYKQYAMVYCPHCGRKIRA